MSELFIPPFRRSDIRGRLRSALFLFFGENFGEKILITRQYKTTNKKRKKAENAVISTLSANKTIQNNIHFHA